MQKNRKEHLFCNAIHGIIESVDKVKDQKRTVFNIEEKLSMTQFQKEQKKYGNILHPDMELFWRNGIMILTMCM